MLTYFYSSGPIPIEVERILATLTNCQSFEQQYETLQDMCSEKAKTVGHYRFSKLDTLEYALGPFRFALCLPMYSESCFQPLLELDEAKQTFAPIPLLCIRCSHEMDLHLVRFHGDWQENDRLTNVTTHGLDVASISQFASSLAQALDRGIVHYGACRNSNYWAINSCTKEIVIPTWDQYRKINNSAEYRTHLNHLRETFRSVIDECSSKSHA